jgi:hypothetical protein
VRPRPFRPLASWDIDFSPKPISRPWLRPVLALCVLAFCFIFAVGVITVCGWVL